MIELFEQPKKITLREYIEELRHSNHYIERFEYGDFDNWNIAYIEDCNLSLKYSHFYPDTIYGPRWNFSLKKEWVSLNNVITPDGKQVIGDKDVVINGTTFVGYDDYYAKDFDDLYNQEIFVIGVYKEKA